MNLKSLFEKDKAILSQKVDHMEIQLREAKKREVKLKESYQKMIEFVQNLKDEGRVNNTVYLEGCKTGVFSSVDYGNSDSERRSTAQFANPSTRVILDDC